MTTNAAGPKIELPDEGVSAAELEEMTNPVMRRTMIQEALRQGRYTNVNVGILPKLASTASRAAANGNGQTADAAGAGGGSTAGVGVAGGSGPGGPSAGPGGGAAAAAGPVPGVGAVSLRVPWGPRTETRDRAKIDCARLLAERAPRLYKRGELLAVMAFPEAAAGEGRKVLFDVDATLQRARIASVDDLENSQVDEAGIQFVGRGKGRPNAVGVDDIFRGNIAKEKLVPIPPPKPPLKAIIADPGLCPARRLNGIARVPYMDARGDLHMTASGYNEATGIYHDLAGLAPLNVPIRPTRQEVQAAIETLLHPFEHYENFLGDRMRKLRWVGEVLALCLTAVERPFLPTAPLLMINGNSGGVGKGQLCSAIIWLGYAARGDLITMSDGGKEEELGKRVEAVILNGAPAFTIDNMNDFMLRSGALASYCTEGWADIRPLGATRLVRAQDRCLAMLNGNGLVPSEDIARRTLYIDLTTSDPFPAGRHFRFEPFEEVRRTRTAMLEAAFTIMRWWRQQGMPKTDREAGSFKAWNNQVGDLAHALTEWHPADSIKANQDIDPFRQNMSKAFHTLSDRFGRGTVFISTNVEKIADAVANAARQGVDYAVHENDLDLRIFPALVAQLVALQAAEQAAAAVHGNVAGAHRALNAELEKMRTRNASVGGTASGGAGGGLPLELAALKAATDAVNAGRGAACREQTRIDVDLVTAIKSVTYQGKTDARAIGEWARKAHKRIFDGLKLVRDPKYSTRSVGLMVVEA